MAGNKKTLILENGAALFWQASLLILMTLILIVVSLYSFLVQPVFIPMSDRPANSVRVDQSAQWLSYIDKQNGFELKYPNNFTVLTDTKKINLTAYIPVCDAGDSIVCFVFPKEQYQNTSLEGAGFSVNRIKSAKSQKACMTFDISASEIKGSEKFNGTVFATGREGGAAAGNMSDDKFYRNFHNGTCFELRARISTQNVAMLDATSGAFNELLPADEARIRKELDQIAATFKFID